MLYLPRENVLKVMWGESLIREAMADMERGLSEFDQVLTSLEAERG